MYVGINLDRVLPRLSIMPTPGETMVTPGGVCIRVESVCSIERCRMVATGRPVSRHKCRYEPSVHCFMFWGDFDA